MSGYHDSHRTAERATAYDREYQIPGHPDEILWHLEQQILRRVLTPDHPTRVLDFATGTGRIAHFLESTLPDARIDAVDISPEMLTIARGRCRAVELVEGDLTSDDALLPGPYDLITAFRFFLRAEDRLRCDALAAFERRLAPGGRLVANFQRNPHSLRGAWVHARARTHHLPVLTPHDVERLLDANGFEVIELIGYQHSPYRSFPTGPIRVRRRIDSTLARVTALGRVGGAFIVVAQPLAR